MCVKNIRLISRRQGNFQNLCFHASHLTSNSFQYSPQFYIDHICTLFTPQNFNCITVIFYFSWDDCDTQKKLETMVMQFYFIHLFLFFGG